MFVCHKDSINNRTNKYIKISGEFSIRVEKEIEHPFSLIPGTR